MSAKTIEERAADLMRDAEKVHRRVHRCDDGTFMIAGWQGFHMDLDAIEATVVELRQLARGLR